MNYIFNCIIWCKFTASALAKGKAPLSLKPAECLREQKWPEDQTGNGRNWKTNLLWKARLLRSPAGVTRLLMMLCEWTGTKDQRGTFIDWEQMERWRRRLMNYCFNIIVISNIIIIILIVIIIGFIIIIIISSSSSNSSSSISNEFNLILIINRDPID